MPLTQVQNGMLAGVIPASLGGTGTTAGVTGFKNRLINGDMTFAQRSVGPVNNSSAGATLIYDTVDRFGYWAQFANIFTTQQSSVAPAGFKNSVLITSLASTTISSNSYYLYGQRIEGFNMSDLDWGTSNAKTVTFSFWVRSSLTGTFSGYVFNNGYSYNYPFIYTIAAANTWEQKSITIAGPTAGTWLSNNGVGIEIGLTLGIGANYQSTANTWTAGSFASGSPGSTNLVATNGATLYTTGWQLEVGSAATNFDVLSYSTELALCQRYFTIYRGGTYGGFQVAGSVFSMNLAVPVPMRTTPSFSTTITDANFVVGFPSANQWCMYLQNSGYSSYSGSINTLSFNGVAVNSNQFNIGTYGCTLGTNFTGFILGSNSNFSFNAEL